MLHSFRKLNTWPTYPIALEPVAAHHSGSHGGKLIYFMSRKKRGGGRKEGSRSPFKRVPQLPSPANSNSIKRLHQLPIASNVGKEAFMGDSQRAKYSMQKSSFVIQFFTWKHDFYC